MLPPRRAPNPAPWQADENATASINYTSGTTARPKGVQLTHRNIWLNAVTFGWHAGVSDRDTYLHTLPMFHCNGWGMPYALTAMGVPQVVLRKVDGEDILARIAEHGVSLLCGAPAVVAAILDAAGKRVSAGQSVPGGDRGVRMVVAGAPPPTKTIERVDTELGWEFIQIYGLTETSPLLMMNRAPSEWDDLSPTERADVARPCRRRHHRRDDQASTRTAKSWPARTTCSRGTGSSPRRRPRRSTAVGSTPATAARSTSTATS